ncbi:hypothetical protein DFH27DRAFT_657043 [Peziza echinospora]|nr:hypothetical protein DFH27DRAFT_657043 [Peziza echinospora]
MAFIGTKSAYLFILPGLWLFFRGKAFFGRIRKAPNPPLKTPIATEIMLNLLYITTIVAFCSTFAAFYKENFFEATQSQLLETSTENVFNKYKALRPEYSEKGDEDLWRRLQSEEGRILYARFGPNTLGGCEWCTVTDPASFLVYQLPTSFAIHLAHIGVLFLATSSRLPFLGLNRPGNVWQSYAIWIAFGIMVGEIYMLTKHPTENLESESPEDDTYTYRSIIFYRGLLMAVLDGVLGFLINFTASGRLDYNILKSTAERVEDVGKSMERGINGIVSAVCLKQAIMRESHLRQRATSFWEREEKDDRNLMRNPTVHAAFQEVRRSQDWSGAEAEARRRARAIIRGLYVKREPVESEVETSFAESQQDTSQSDVSFVEPTPQKLRRRRTVLDDEDSVGGELTATEDDYSEGGDYSQNSQSSSAYYGGSSKMVNRSFR